MNVTIEQIKNLWNNGGTIDRGDDYAPITQDDLGALDIDTDDNGTPLESEWQVIADQLNSEVEGVPSSSAGQDFLQVVADARLERDKAKDAADKKFNDLIRSFMLTEKKDRPASVMAVAAAADMSRERMYQIRDGRR